MRVDIENIKSTVELNRINDGKTFLYGGRYYIATDERENKTAKRLCVELAGGTIHRLDFDERVTPVSLIVTLDPEGGRKE